jgi:MarR family transcriptional regulator for hemolysin
VLAYLAEFGAATQTMIAGHLGQGRAATGVTIDRLHERGMVMRAADPVDRRVWIVRLTTVGFNLVERIETVDEVLREELREGIPRSERRALAALLQKLQDNLHGVIGS